MPRSLYASLHHLYRPRRSETELFNLAHEKRQSLYDQQLMPGALSADALSSSQRLASTRIAAVGGGLAGLAAAWYLQQCGAKVTVFEANDRLGGRVLSDYTFIPGKTAEFGAELIGANHPMWSELAISFGLSLVEISKEEDYEQAGLQVRMRLGDHDLTDVEKKQLIEDLEPVLDAIGRDAKEVDPAQPWTSPNADTFDQMSVADRLDELVDPTSNRVRTALEFILGNDNCAPVANQSYLGLLTLVSAGRMGDDPAGMRGYWEYTETHRCDGGNQQMANELARPLIDLRLSTPVQTIVIADESVGITWGDGEVGGDEAFDYVVLATAPAVWPTIECERYSWDPDEYTMAHGPAVKHLSAFEGPFWSDQALAPSALWDRLGSVWETTDRQPTDPLGNGLSVYSGGDYVMGESDYPARLAEIFPGYAPIDTRFVDWPNTRWIGTGYSVPAPGQVTSVGSSLSRPFAERMYFAGEQSCVGYFGYMEGALQSGARAARDLLSAVCPAAFGQSEGEEPISEETVRVLYDVPLIPQPDKLSCWAASIAMLVSYRNQASIDPESLAEEVGRSLRTSYGWDMLEEVKDYYGFVDIELPSNTSLYVQPSQWQEWLERYGPLWVTVIGAPSHAVVVRALVGDGTPEGTKVYVNNPWDIDTAFSNDQVDFVPQNFGKASEPWFVDFAADFGRLGLADYGLWRVLYISSN
jgi:monoamine oxidase